MALRGVLRKYPWWGILFFGIGVLATVTVLAFLFAGIGRRPTDVGITAPAAAGSEEFMLALSGAVFAPVRDGGRVELLSNGVEFFPSLLQTLGGAQSSINFMVYIWEPGVVSDTVFDVLVERARAGVEVRVMLDGFGAQNAPGDRVEELRAAGGKVVFFRPLRLWSINRFHRRNHRRAIVVDGEAGFTGGALVGDKWLGDAQAPDFWRDDMVRVTGPLARSLQAAFAQLWSNSTGEILAGPRFYPAEPASAGPGETVARHVSVVSSPSEENLPLRKLFWMSFAGARRSIYVTNPYFIPDAAVRGALKERARAGVDVRVVTVNEHTDGAPVRWAAQHYYEELLEAGVRVYEYQPTMMHSKNLVVDGVWSVVGSANLDVRSKELNEENVLGILDRSFAAELERVFAADIAESREFTLAEWRQRGAWPRFREGVAVLFEEQF